MFEQEMNEQYALFSSDEDFEFRHDPARRRELVSKKNHEITTKFLGEGARSVEVLEGKCYYWQLLAWTAKSFFASSEWKTIAIHGFTNRQPAYRNIQTDYTKFESCLVDGQMLMENGDVRYVITVIAGPSVASFIQIESTIDHQEQVERLLPEIADFKAKNNFYRGKRICLNHEVSFVIAGQKDWDSVILDPVMKREIRLNTIEFLKNCDKLEKYHIPSRRGIILAGEPGTGKTKICKALMAEADGITCIFTTADRMSYEGYVSIIFIIAQELSPSIVFIEDLDFIGQERRDYYRGTSPMMALLSEMDGIEEKKAIVVVATTNGLETLDKALIERPSRFDRIFKIERPNYQLRTELLKYIAKSISLSEDIIEYIVKRTDGFTPAQLQEVSFGMAISHVSAGQEPPEFTRSDVDSVIALINYRKTGKIGFNTV